MGGGNHYDDDVRVTRASRLIPGRSATTLSQGRNTDLSKEIRCQDVVVGSGMQGFAAARACLSQGRDCVVIQKGQSVGGVLQPVIIDGVSLDPGCHLWISGAGTVAQSEIDFI